MIEEMSKTGEDGKVDKRTNECGKAGIWGREDTLARSRTEIRKEGESK